MGGSGSSSIFGGAKPVDTAAREREIEEKLASEKHHREEKISKEKESTTDGKHSTVFFRGSIYYASVCMRKRGIR